MPKDPVLMCFGMWAIWVELINQTVDLACCLLALFKCNKVPKAHHKFSQCVILLIKI